MKIRLIALFLLLTLVGTLTGCGITVPRPEVEEGEFNFSMTYEINGKVDTLSAVYMCEFDGVSWSVDGGYGRDWKAHTEGDYEGDDYSAIIGTTEDGGDIVLFFGIYPEYFMNDSTGDRGAPEPSLYISYTLDVDEYGLVSDPLEVEEIYGAKIISYEYDAPIVNTFNLFDF